MLYSIKSRDDSENLNELILLPSEVKVLRLLMKIWKAYLNPWLNKSIKDVSQDITKTITETSIENNKALSNFNEKLLEIMNNKGILASYLLSPLSKITKPEHPSQFKLVQDPSSKESTIC